jgi:hypothetical protein
MPLECRIALATQTCLYAGPQTSLYHKPTVAEKVWRGAATFVPALLCRVRTNCLLSTAAAAWWPQRSLAERDHRRCVLVMSAVVVVCRLKRRAQCVCVASHPHSVGFNFLGRDFYNSIAEKNADVRSLSFHAHRWLPARSKLSRGFVSATGEPLAYALKGQAKAMAAGFEYCRDNSLLAYPMPLLELLCFPHHHTALCPLGETPQRAAHARGGGVWTMNRRTSSGCC